MTILANSFPAMPDHASLWTYVASKPLSEAMQAELSGALEEFFATWTSHDSRVNGRSLVLEDRFLLIAAHVPDGDLSGCGIDKSTRVLDEIGASNDFVWLDGLDVHYRGAGGSVVSASRAEFRSSIREGSIMGDTVVFDLTAKSVGELRTNGFEKPVSDSWHGNVFGVLSAQEA